MEWNCKNCKVLVKKNVQCKCGNREDNWACMSCHVCNPTGNSLKKCGGNTN
jgi:hypothetical protein